MKNSIKYKVLTLVLFVSMGAMVGCRTTNAEPDQAAVYSQCTAIKEEGQQKISDLEKQIAEKDKKITWLRKKAKDAGADLTK